ncbi:hypothetical protein ACS0TY_033613 [Phlomoides rotata]
MSSEKGICIVVMGVSGAGKSTIGVMLAEVINGRFLDADDYHSQSNKDKMKNGIPLSEEDRIPWLETLRDALRVSLGKGETVVLGCSALQKHYRDILRCGDANYIPGSNIDDESEGILKVDASLEPHHTLKSVQALLSSYLPSIPVHLNGSV